MFVSLPTGNSLFYMGSTQGHEQSHTLGCRCRCSQFASQLHTSCHKRRMARESCGGGVADEVAASAATCGKLSVVVGVAAARHVYVYVYPNNFIRELSST